VILPTRQEDRNSLFINTARECLASSERRRAHHRRLRLYALEGTEGSVPVKRNKLIEFIETSSAYCYAPEFVKFGVTLPKRYGDSWIEELDAARDEAGDLFLASGADAAFGLMVDWAHVYPSMFGKVIVSDHQVVLEVVPDPADVGAWEENLPSLDRQEALVHTFGMNLAMVTRLIRQSVPNRADADTLIEHARDHKLRGGRSSLAPAIPQIVLATAGPPNMIGAVQNLHDSATADPEVQVDIVPMCELWIRDDLAYPSCDRCHRRESDDAHVQGPLYDHAYKPSGEHEWEWRKVLCLGENGDIPLWGTLNPLLPQRQPLIQLTLGPTPGYLWGVSPLQKLIALQVLGEELLSKHLTLLDLQLDPPIAITGISNVDGERAKMLREVGGTFTMPYGPGAKIERFTPETPPDAAGMTKLIDDAIDRAGGLPMGSHPTTDANVRSAGQMTAGAELSAPRVNRRAMRVEDALEEVMTPAFRLHRRISKDPLRVPLKEPDQETQKDYRQFLLSQLPGELSVRVSAHSASPLFRKQMREDAIILKREGAIDKETFVEILGPPMEDMVRQKARRIQASEAQKTERVLEIKEREAAAKEAKAARK
jgi:hypothetical protein